MTIYTGPIRPVHPEVLEELSDRLMHAQNNPTFRVVYNAARPPATMWKCNLCSRWRHVEDPRCLDCVPIL